ncbi:MAG: response regulator [Verrucomicrobia bacterium]|nr:response regulator [Verrucomicrobiota bacterium]
MAKETILIVEDDEDIRELIKFNLASEGFKIISSETGEAGLRAARDDLPDLIVLDLMLPGIDGLDVCRVLKNDPKTRHIAIVMVTAKGEETDVVAGLELGADDYVTKPFSPKVLIARVRTVLRRKSREEPDEMAPVTRGDLVIDPGRHQVLLRNKPLDLTATEFGVLHLLARKPGWVFTRQQIVDNVKGEDYAVTERSVDVQMVGLRKKLGRYADAIETVRGVGYRFKE